MNAKVFGTAIGIGVLAAFFYLYKAVPPGDTIDVHFTEAGYAPAQLILKKGDTIKFINDSSKEFWPASNIHPTHEIYSEFDPKRALPAGDSWSFRFTRPGVWRFHDHIAPEFTGIVTVQE